MLDQGAGDPGSAELQAGLDDGWIIRVASSGETPLRAVLRRSLQQGEVEAILLSLESGAVLLCDDQDAVREARSRGVAVTGTLGLLVKAKRTGRIELVAPILTELRKRGFWLNKTVERETLALAGELP